MENHHKAASFHYLPIICKDNSSLNTKIALMTFKRQKYSSLLEILLIILEYLQLMSQAILVQNNSFESSNENGYIMTRVFVFLAQALNPGSWLSFDNHPTFTLIILVINLIYTLLKYVLLFYIVGISVRGVNGNNDMIDIWGYIVKIQDRALFFISTSLWGSVILAISDERFDFSIGKTASVFISLTLITLELIFSLFIQLCYTYILSSKSFLSAKDNKIEIMILVQKFFTQLLQIILSDNFLLLLISAPLNATLSFIRVVYFFSTLPNYNIKALKYRAILSAIVSALSLSSGIDLIVRTATYETNMNLFLVIWAISSILMVKASTGYLEKLIINIMTTKKPLSAELLIHRIYIAKYFRKLKSSPSEFNEKCQYSYLVNITIDANLKALFNTTNDNLNVDSKKSTNKVFLQYLENATSTKLSNNSMLKLQIAYFYARKLHLYSRAMRVISEIQRFHSYKYALNACLLIYDMQNSMKIKYTNRDTEIDLSTYLKSRTDVALLKEKIIDQAELQIQVYQEILGDHPDLEKIFELSQTISNHRNQVERKAKQTLCIVPDHYIEPLMVLAEYNSALNFSVIKRNFYYNKHTQKSKKYEKCFKNNKLIPENLYEDDNVFFILSIEKVADAGKVLFVTKSVERMYGGEASLYIGTDVVGTAAPCFRSFYGAFYKNIAETGDTSLIGSSTRGYGYHRDGYMVEVDFYINAFPYLTKGCCLGIMMRPVPPPLKDHLFILENGDIDCGTKIISERLGLLDTKRLSEGVAKVNVKAVSQQLNRINEAFNIIANNDIEKKNEESNKDKKSEEINSPEKENKSLNLPNLKTEDSIFGKFAKSGNIPLTYEEALEIYEKYTTTGGEVTFYSASHKKDKSNRSGRQTKSFVYKCNLLNAFVGPTKLKIMALEPCKAEGEEEEFKECSHIINRVGSQVVSETNNRKFDVRNVEIQEAEEDANEEDSANINSEDEKGNLVDLPNITTGQMSSPHVREALVSQNETHKTTEGYLLSPLSQTDPLISLKVLRKVQTNKKYESSESSKSEDKKAKNNKVVKPAQTEGSRESRLSSLGGQRGRISGAFENSLALKYYPRNLKMIYILFYFMIFAFLVGQFTFKITLEDAIKNIRAIKDIASNFELKSYLLLGADLASLMLWTLGTGRMNLTEISELSYSPESHRQALKNNLIGLTDTNAALLLSTNYLNEKSHEILFRRDVRVFDTYFNESEQIFENYDNFQATDRIIEVGLKLYSRLALNFTDAAIPEIEFLLRNCVNDILLKNEAISDSFMASLIEEGDGIISLVDKYFIATVLLSGLQILLFMTIIWKQYFKDKSLMLAVVKLNRFELNDLLEKTVAFKNMIENEEPIELRKNTRAFQKDIDRKTEAKKESSVKPKFGRKRKRYHLYATKLIFFMILLISTIIWFWISSRNYLQFFHTKQSQLHFSLRLKSHILLMGVMSQDLIVSNGTTMNHNIPTPVQMVRSINDLITMRNRIPTIFSSKDANFGYGVDTVLYSDGCFLLKGIWGQLCNMLEQQSKETNLINLLSELESLLTQRKERFEISDKSLQSIINLATQDFDDISLLLGIIIAECDSIVSVTAQEYESNLDNAKDKGNLFFGLFFCFIVIDSLLVWVFLLSQFKEIDNQLKKVLQVFPARLVLSNFTLKSFLIKTSKEALEFVKNYL